MSLSNLERSLRSGSGIADQSVPGIVHRSDQHIDLPSGSRNDRRWSGAMMTDFVDRLRSAADALVKIERETALRGGNVRRFVTLNCDLLLELREQVHGWRQVATLLQTEGLKWSNGAPVTADQLRSLVSAVRRDGARRRRPAATPPPAPSAPAARTPASQPRPTGGLAALLDIPRRAR